MIQKVNTIKQQVQVFVLRVIWFSDGRVLARCACFTLLEFLHVFDAENHQVELPRQN